MHGRVVLLVRPAFRRDGRVVEEAEKDLVGRGRGDVGRRALAAECHDPGILLRLRMIDRAVLDQPSARDFGDDLIPPRHPVQPVVGDAADRRRLELPLRGDRLDVRHAVGLRHDQHPLLRLGEQDLVGRHPGLARRHQRRVDLHARPAAGGHLRRRRRQAGRPHVLNGHDVPRGDELQARLEQQLLGEGVAHLDLGAAPLAFVRQLFRREGGAVDAVAPGARSHDEEHVAHAVRRGRDEIPLPQDAHAHRVHERVPRIARAEVHLPADRGDAHAVAVIPDPAHHARDEVAVARFVERAEAQAVEQRHGAGAHGEDVAQDAAHAGRGALVGLHRRRVVVRLDLERHGPAVGEPQDPRVLARPLDHLGARGGQRLEDRLGVLVGAVLAPQGGEDAQLGEGGRTPEQCFDAGVLGGGQVVLAGELGRDRRIAGEGGRPGHASGTFAPVTPRITVRKTRLMMPDSCCSRVSTSPLSNHTP